MSGIGEDSHKEQHAALEAALQEYARSVYGPDYIVQDFVAVAFVVNMTEDNEVSEYAMASSSAAVHVNEGLIIRARDILLEGCESPDEP